LLYLVASIKSEPPLHATIYDNKKTLLSKTLPAKKILNTLLYEIAQYDIVLAVHYIFYIKIAFDEFIHASNRERKNICYLIKNDIN